MLYLRVSLTRVTALAPGCESVRLLPPGPGPHHRVARAAVRGGSQHPHGAARPKYEYFLLGRETWQPRLWWLLVAHQPRILLRLQLLRGCDPGDITPHPADNPSQSGT